MIAEESPRMSATALVGLLARAVQKMAPTSGDHRTAIPELTLHRRNRPTQVVYCVYTLGMALTVQGSKHVLLGEMNLSYGSGQSLLTTVDLPVSYHITRATATEPYLGIMLRFDRSLLTQLASTLERPQPSKAAAYEPISLQRLAKAAELVEASVDETLSYYSFPPEHWRSIRTNNPNNLPELQRRSNVRKKIDTTKAATIGLDIAKQVFQVHGTDRTGRGVLRRKLRRNEVNQTHQ